MSYIFGHYRAYELKHRGKPNQYGLESAPRESILRWVEIIVDLLIFGISIYHLSTLTVA
jgi:hypothetical protein